MRISVLGAGLLAASLASAAVEDPHSEIFTGIEACNNAVSGYLGAGYAFGKGLYDQGWRLRAVGSLGRYEGTVRRGLGSRHHVRRRCELWRLLGYQLRAQSVFVKLFAGVEAEDQDITPRDPQNLVQGSAVGLKLVAESWLDVSPLWFVSVDASYGTAFQQYWSLARAGYRVRPRLALGIESGALGNEEYDAGRAGGFVKASLRALEVTLSGGFTGNYLEDEPSRSPKSALS